MEEICCVINKFGKVNQTIRHVSRKTHDETNFNLDVLSTIMLKSIDETKVSNLVLFPENFGNDNMEIICFDYNGFKCVILELIEFEYEELVLFVSPY